MLPNHVRTAADLHRRYGPLYMTLEDISERTGLTTSTLRTYRGEGKLPEADVVFGQCHAWLAETVIGWDRERGKRPKQNEARS